jgi:hypothetical protein
LHFFCLCAETPSRSHNHPSQGVRCVLMLLPERRPWWFLLQQHLLLLQLLPGARALNGGEEQQTAPNPQKMWKTRPNNPEKREEGQLVNPHSKNGMSLWR